MAIMLLASARAEAPRASIPAQIGPAVATFATAAGIWEDELRGATRMRIIEFDYGVVKVFYRNRRRECGRALDGAESPALDGWTLHPFRSLERASERAGERASERVNARARSFSRLVADRGGGLLEAEPLRPR